MRLIGHFSLLGVAIKRSSRNAALAGGNGAGSWHPRESTRFSLAGGCNHARGVAEGATTRTGLVRSSSPLRVSLEGNIASGEATFAPAEQIVCPPSPSRMCREGKPPSFPYHRVGLTREEHPPRNTRQQVSAANRSGTSFKMAKRDEVACCPPPVLPSSAPLPTVGRTGKGTDDPHLAATEETKQGGICWNFSTAIPRDGRTPSRRTRFSGQKCCLCAGAGCAAWIGLFLFGDSFY